MKHSLPPMGEWLVAVVREADSCGLLDALEPPSSLDQLAARLPVDRRALGLVLGVLERLGFVELKDGVYHRQAKMARDTWQSLNRFLRTGIVMPLLDQPRQRDHYAKTVRRMGELFDPFAQDIAVRLHESSNNMRHIVDVGAGSGVWSLRMAEVQGMNGGPSCRVTAIDLPAVTECFLATARERGMAEQVEVIPMSYWESAAPLCDRVVLANVLHLEPADDAALLVRKFAKQLSPHGEMVIVCTLGDGTFGGELWEAMYCLDLGMRTARGKPHSLLEMSGWCAQAGLERIEVLYPERNTIGPAAIVARKMVDSQS